MSVHNNHSIIKINGTNHGEGINIHHLLSTLTQRMNMSMRLIFSLHIHFTNIFHVKIVLNLGCGMYTSIPAWIQKRCLYLVEKKPGHPKSGIQDALVKVTKKGLSSPWEVHLCNLGDGEGGSTQIWISDGGGGKPSNSNLNFKFSFFGVGK